MQRLIPVWFFLFCLLVGLLFTVVFGWWVKSTVGGSARFGRVGETAVVVASFPDTARSALKAIGADPDKDFRVPRTGADLSGFRPLKAKQGLEVQGLLVRADEAALARAPGWRVLVGGFVIGGKFTHAALALSPELEIVKVWPLPEDDIEGEEPRPPFGKFPHGFAILKDGSVIYSFDVGVSIQRLDACGRRVWAIGGQFGHSVTPVEGEEYVWTLRNDLVGEVVQVATATGKVLRRITMEQIISANPEVELLEIRRKDNNWVNGNPRKTQDSWLDDPFHLNDVEPLPAAIADQFPGFEAGDLLLSARSLNLVFVLDPDTLKVKWWRTGGWRRQHDPDWQRTGEITVYDNQMNGGYSRILGTRPAADGLRVVLDGQSMDFYSRIRGKHQFTDTGNLVISSPQQGRVFELDPEGRTVLEMFNTRPGNGEFNYPLSELIWYPSGAFDFAKDFSCAS